MKNLLALILIMGIISSTCTQISVGEFLNDSTNIAPGNCITITDNTTNSSYTIVSQLSSQVISVLPEQIFTEPVSNVTCKGGTVKQNQTLIHSTNPLVDPISNNTYICSFPFQNTNLLGDQSLSLSDGRNLSITCSNSALSLINDVSNTVTYLNPSRNVTIQFNSTLLCAENIIHNSGYNESFHLNKSNSTITCPVYPMAHVNQSLNFSGSYYNATTDTYISCPSFPLVNQVFRPGIEETQTNSLFNFSIIGASCKQNVTTTPPIDGQYSNNICNITCNGIKSSSLDLNETLKPNYGENKTSSKYGVMCVAPPKPNINLHLYDGELYNRSDTNETIDCTYNESLVPLCSEVKINTTALELLNNNQTKCISTPMCLNLFSQHCTSDEGATGNIYGCFDRVIAASNLNYQTCTNQSILKDQTIEQLKTPLTFSFEFIKWGLAGLTLLTLVIGVSVYLIITERRKGTSSVISPPRRVLKPFEGDLGDLFKKGGKND